MFKKKFLFLSAIMPLVPYIFLGCWFPALSVYWGCTTNTVETEQEENCDYAMEVSKIKKTSIDGNDLYTKIIHPS